MKVYLKPRCADPNSSMLDDCEMLSAFITKTIQENPTMSPSDAMRAVQQQTDRVFRFDWNLVWLVVEESCEKTEQPAPLHESPGGPHRTRNTVFRIVDEEIPDAS